jgi:hypothetical protein
MPTTELGVETVSHFMMPGSAETADGAAMCAGITKEATINIAAKTPRILGYLVFIIPPDLFKPGASPREPPANVRPLARRFFTDNFLRVVTSVILQEFNAALSRPPPWCKTLCPGTRADDITSSAVRTARLGSAHAHHLLFFIGKYLIIKMCVFSIEKVIRMLLMIC